MTTIAFHTLGCKVNQYESKALSREAERYGLSVTDFSSPADIYIINTCTVTQLADKKSRKAIKLAKKRNPNAKIIVTGCYGELQPEEIKEVGEADLIVKNREKRELIKKLCPHSNPHPAVLEPRLPYERPSPYGRGLPAGQAGKEGEGFRIRENLMIEDGCEEFCNYCIVPYARGSVRSKPIHEAVKEAKEMVRSGVKEIVLTGINLGAYGDKLPDLIGQLAKIEGLLRIRLSSLEPMYITKELIEAIASTPKVMKHLHIPLQSGSDKVLKAMGRRYSTADYRKLIMAIRSKIPRIALNTDIIVGFPGETENDLKDTVRFVQETGFSRIHVFSFSVRPGTLAAEMQNKIEPIVIRERAEKMQALRIRLMRDFTKASMKEPEHVLVEGIDKRYGLLEGLTESYIRVFFKGSKNLIGKIAKVNIRDIRNEFVTGELSS
jgi:threonylcarbamoyladenosine tRNA methylthiotransferase MtaB